MSHGSRITADCQVMLGKPIIKGTCITVDLILRKLSEGTTPADLIVMYPQLKQADVLAALDLAAKVVANEEVLVGSNAISPKTPHSDWVELWDRLDQKLSQSDSPITDQDIIHEVNAYRREKE